MFGGCLGDASDAWPRVTWWASGKVGESGALDRVPVQWGKSYFFKPNEIVVHVI